MSREWERALERQLALLEWFKYGSASTFLQFFARMYPHGLPAEALRKSLVNLLAEADTFYVSEDMVKLVEVAAQSIGEPVLERHVPFTEAGFAFLQAPLHLEGEWYVDETGRTSLQAWDIRAVAWQVGMSRLPGTDGVAPDDVPGINVCLFGSDSNMDDFVEWLEKGSIDGVRLSDLVTGNRGYGLVDPRDVEQMDTDRTAYLVTYGDFRPPPMLMFEITSWAFGVEWESSRDPEQWKVGEGVWAPVGEVRRLLYALWALMAQPIAAPRSEHPSREYRRRWERQQDRKWLPDYGVRVVTLRRAMNDSDGEQDAEWGREWTHRWIVRGHWRRQWYPSEEVHRMVWIAPYVKGPDDKPLVVRDQVFEVVR